MLWEALKVTVEQALDSEIKRLANGGFGVEVGVGLWLRLGDRLKVELGVGLDERVEVELGV